MMTPKRHLLIISCLIVLSSVVIGQETSNDGAKMNIGEERTKGCLDKLESDFEQSVTVPEQVIALAQRIRALNPHLDPEMSLLKLLTNKQANLSKIKRDSPSDGVDELWEVCSKFMLKVMSLAESTRCAQELIWLMNPNNPDYNKSMENRNYLEEIMGYRMACARI